MYFISVLLALGLLVCGGLPLFAGEIIREEKYCGLLELPASLRQTVVVVDARLILGGDMTGNREWAAPLAAFLDARKSSVSAAFTPRERITILVAQPGSSAPEVIFSGCHPTYAAPELAKLKESSGGVTGFSQFLFGSDYAATLRADQDRFADAVLDSLSGAILNQQQVPPTPDTKDGFLKILDGIGGMINLQNGVPRIVLISNLPRLDADRFKSVEEARADGFQKAYDAPADLKGSDVYIVLPQAQLTDPARQFVNAYVEATGGYVVAWQTRSIGVTVAPPVRVMRFVGEVDYGKSKAVMRFRLAQDQNGGLVQSWVMVSSPVDKGFAVPLTGDLLCQSGECTIKGDGKNFSQSRAIKVGGKFQYDPRVPFGGLQQFEATLKDDVITGRIFQPEVKIGPDNKDALSFTLKRVKSYDF